MWNPRNSPISSRNCPHSQPLQLNSLPVDRFCFQANPVDWVPREFSRHSLGCSVSWRVGGLEGPVSTYLSIKHWILPHGGDRGPQNPMSDGEIRLQAVGGHWKAFKDLPSTLDFPVSHSSRASAPGKSGVEGRVLHPGWPTGQVFSLSFDGFSPTRHTFLWACRRPINDERKTSSWSSTLHALGLSLKTLPGALTRVSSRTHRILSLKTRGQRRGHLLFSSLPRDRPRGHPRRVEGEEIRLQAVGDVFLWQSRVGDRRVSLASGEADL